VRGRKKRKRRKGIDKIGPEEEEEEEDIIGVDISISISVKGAAVVPAAVTGSSNISFK
jgi:hypothetical protein